MQWFMILFFIGLVNFSASADEVKVGVQGMVCGLCAQGITKKFSSEKSVSAVNVSLENQWVTVVLKDGENLSDEIIANHVREAGFTPGKITR